MTYKVISPIGSVLKFFIQMCSMDLNTDADALPAIAKFKRNKSIGAAIKHCKCVCKYVQIGHITIENLTDLKTL